MQEKKRKENDASANPAIKISPRSALYPLLLTDEAINLKE